MFANSSYNVFALEFIVSTLFTLLYHLDNVLLVSNFVLEMLEYSA